MPKTLDSNSFLDKVLNYVQTQLELEARDEAVLNLPKRWIHPAGEYISKAGYNVRTRVETSPRSIAGLVFVDGSKYSLLVTKKR